VARVTQLGTQGRELERGRHARRRGGAGAWRISPAWGVRLLWGSGLGANVPVHVRGTISSGNEVPAGLGPATVDMATAERRWRNAGVVFWPSEWPTRHYSMRKRERGIGKCSPRPEIEEGGRAGAVVSKSGGDGERSSWPGAKKGASGRLGGTD
jgi:hypothetical protein